MLSTVRIENYKSLRSVSFNARRVNLFIGEPNTGKSNIIEALALLSGRFDKDEFREIFRFHSIADLFCDQQVRNAIEVEVNGVLCKLVFQSGSFNLRQEIKGKPVREIYLNQTGDFSNWLDNNSGDVRLYRFKEGVQINRQDYGPLQVPYGHNLVTILYTNKELRRRVNEMFRTRGFRIEIKPVTMELLLAKSLDDELYSFPYDSVSETWRRLVFYMAVLETNKNATLLLDEPESNTFPFYTKYLAERIALDETNQFFLTTHNPYLLASIVEKSKVEDVAVFVTSMDKFETRLSPIPESKLPELLELNSDAFFNLDRLVEA